MIFSKFFIDRPIFSTVISIGMIFAGLITLFTLPVAQFPDITPPTVQVSATYPGANAQTVAETVGVPIEGQVNGVEGMMYMQSSSSSSGEYNLTVTFELGTDIDMATVMVQNRVAIAQGSLPESVIQQGITTSKKSTNTVLFLSLISKNKNYDALYLSNYAEINIVDELSRVNGVGGVSVFGTGNYSMRVWLNPDVMRIRNITPQDVYTAIQSQNMAVSAGSVGAPPNVGDVQFQFTLVSPGRLITPEQFNNIILKSNEDGTILRLGDVATIDMGSVSYNMSSRLSGEQVASIGISQMPGSNALDVAKAVEAKMKQLEQYFPEGVEYETVLDTTNFVSQSIEEVIVTFVETTLIVMLVIMLFLQNWRAVIIPMITIPVSLIATFAVMKMLGFTINTLTLFGLVLAIAIVVDDAIVVVEDVSRLLDTGKYSRHDATVKAMQELESPIIGEVLVLMSVFIPTAFISGITGQLYKQFALTIAISTAFSGFNALTFTPAMCALFLKPVGETKFVLYKWFNNGFGYVVSLYTRGVKLMLQSPIISMFVFLIMTLVAFWGYVKWPTSYIPNEDMGYFITSIQLPTGASLERTEKVTAEVEKILKSFPEVENVMTINGFSLMANGASSNMASAFVVLKPWNERKGKEHTSFAIIDKANMAYQRIEEAIIFSLNPSAIPGLGNSGGLELELEDINNLGADEIKAAIQNIQVAVANSTNLSSITTLYEGNTPQYTLNIDRDKVKMQGLTLSNVFSTLAYYMGQAYVNDFVVYGRIFHVMIGADGDTRSTIDGIKKLSVRNSEGKMVPFASFTDIKSTMGENMINRYNMYTSASLTVTPVSNVSSAVGIADTETLINNELGNNFGYSWTGQAYQENESGTTVTIIFIFAIILTILVLAAQYESWTNPLTVILSMPTAILGTVIGCYVMSQSISVYTQIGLILLLGLSAKNAILIVEYAVDYRKSGLSIRESALNAGEVRFRPIIMTALAFVFGVMPMMFATGAGAESRVALGSAVVFGMAINAIIGTLFVPSFWEIMQNIQEKYLAKVFKKS